MHSYTLFLEKDPAKAEWGLYWDDSIFRLKDPDGQLQLDLASDRAHRLIEIYELYFKSQLSLKLPQGPLTFEPMQETVRDDLILYLEEGLKGDADYRADLKRETTAILLRGIAMFIVGTVLFSAYCAWAIHAPDPPSGSWLRIVGILAYPILIVLLAVALAGPFVIRVGWRQRQWLHKVEAQSRSRDAL